MGLIYDPFLGRIRYTWSPGAGIDMSGGTISVITPPDGVPYVAGSGIGIFGSTIYATGGVYTGGFRISVEGTTINQQRYFPIETVSGSTVTLQAGHAYKAYATSGQVTLASELVPAEQIGMDGYLELFVASTGYVQTAPGVILATPVEPDSVNNCRIEFRDGLCTVTVENHIAGYVVVSSTGSTAGTLPYALSSATQDYVAFDASLNGSALDMGGAVTNGEKHVAGNGYTDTILTGGISCTSKTTFANLAMSGVVNSGGTMTLGDIYIPSGGTVSVSGGSLAVERVIGDGGILDLNNTTVIVPNSGNALIGSCTIINGSGGNGGALVLNSSSYVRLDHVTASNCIAAQGGLARLTGGNATLELNRCSVTSCAANYGGGISIAATNAQVFMSNSVVSGNKTLNNFLNDVTIFSGTMYVNGGNTVGITTIRSLASASARVELRDSNAIGAITNVGSNFSASVTIFSGATVDLTSSTLTNAIMPGGGITFEPGGANVIYDSGGLGSSGSYMMDNVTLLAGANLTNTAVVDLGGTHVVVSGGTATASGAAFTGGTGGGVTSGGAFLLSGGTLVLSSSTVSGNNGSYGGGACLKGGVMSAVDTVLSGNTALAGVSVGADLFVSGGTAVIVGGTLADASTNTGGTLVLSGAVSVGIIRKRSESNGGTVKVSSGAAITLTTSIAGNPISVEGGTCTVNGNIVSSGTYTLISSNGTATPAV